MPLSNEEVLCTFMASQPKRPGQTISRAWWRSILRDLRADTLAHIVGLEACREIEARLTAEQWEEYRIALSIPYLRNWPSIKDYIHLEASEKIIALAKVLRPTVEG